MSANVTEDKQWLLLYQQIRQTLSKFGKENAFRRGDFGWNDSYVGCEQQKVYINSLELLRPSVVEALQKSLKNFAGWEIMVAVSIPGIGENWPTMGLTIRDGEIIDGLQRQYFPGDFQNVKYTGSRPGTEHD